MRKFFRATYYLVGTIFFLSIAIAGFTQTKTFRSYLHNLITKSVAIELHGDLQFDPIEGNLFTGFHVNGLTLFESGQPVLEADRLEATYEPLGFAIKRLTFGNIKLVNPRIHLIRSSNGSWNISRLLPAASADTTPSPLVINFKNLQLTNAEISIVDSVKLLAQKKTSSDEAPQSVTDEPILMLHAFDLTASARFAPHSVEATIQELTFTSTKPAFMLSRLSGEFLVSNSEARITKLIVETPESRLTVNASLKNIDVATIHDARELEQKPVALALAVQRLSFADVKRLFPTTLDFLDREVGIQAKIGGTVGKLRIENLLVQGPRSFIKMEGMVNNLHRPRDLELDLICINNKIDPNEIRQFFPAAELPDLHSMGELSYNLRFTGKPAAFKVRFEGTSKAGRLDIDGSVAVNENTLSYDATLKTNRLNLGQLFNNEALNSNLHSTISLKGSGTDLKTMTATARVEIDSSEFYGIPIASSVLTFDVAEKTVQSNVQLNAGSAHIALAGTVHVDQKNAPRYIVDGKVSSFDLATVLKSHHYESNLSFTLRTEGSGLHFQEMQTKLDLVFTASSFGPQKFNEGRVQAELSAADANNQRFHLTSDVADVNIEGKFALDSFVATLHKGGLLIAEAIEHRINSLDSLRGVAAAKEYERAFRSTLHKIPQPVNARFDIAVKDLYPLGVFLGHELAGSGTVTGELVGSLDNLRFTGATKLNAFRYADSTVSLELVGTDLKYRVEGISRASILDSVRAQIAMTGTQMALQNIAFYRPAFDINIQGKAGTFDVSTLIDSSLSVRATGKSLYKNGFIAYTANKLEVGVESYNFTNIEPVVLTLGRDGTQFSNMWMRHDAEEVKVAGYFAPNGVSDLEVNVTNFLLSSLKLFTQNKNVVREVQDFGGTVHARALLRGSLDHPQISLNLAAQGVRYGETAFGQIETRASYLDRMLNLFVEFRSKPDEPARPPDFLISGSLPYDLALKKSSDQPLEGEMDVTIRSKGLRLELIDPFIAELSNLTGTVVCDMKIRGTLNEPRYEGSMSLQLARFMFRPLGIIYIVDGQLIPAGQRIALENFQIRNIPQDQSDGAMKFSGSFTLQGLKFKDFDLQANGQLLVMKELSRQPGQAIYGDLFAAAGSNGLRWRGTPERSVLSGELRVKNANLTLPPTREQLLLSNRDVTITVVDDTAGTKAPGTGEASQESATNGSGTAPLALNNNTFVKIPNAKPKAELLEKKDERSFFDRLVYDLDLETQGPTYVRFIFNPYTGEELFAELKGRMAFTKDGEQTRLTGEVEVGDRSYYNFLKRFQATGKLTFTGDPFNPELNILARYESAYQRADTTQAAGGGTGRFQSSLPEDFHPVRVIVLLQISGTRREPKPKFGIDLVDGRGEHKDYPSGDVESEAITFILTGSFRDELTQQERSSLLTSNLLYGLTSSVLSGPITDFIRKEFGFISSVDVMYYGGSVQSSTDVRVTGEVGEAVIRLGGRVFSDISNTNWSVQLPMSSVLGSDKWRNLIIEAERRVEGIESYEQRRESKGVRLIYRITF